MDGEINWTAVKEEVTGYLRDLVRFDTTNPPGNETPAARYLADILEREGFEVTLLESAPGRGNLIARLEGTGEERPLLLLSHLDVVPAEREEWERDPFGGELVDGYIWGRGTVDTKQLTAMELMTLLLLKRQGFVPRRDIILAATADEEMGGRYGLGWLLETHPHLLDCEYAINEGGGIGFDFGGRRFYVCQTAEKGVCWLKVRTKGRAGHASIPTKDNAVVHLAGALTRLAQAKLPMHRTATVEAFIRGLARGQKFPASLLFPLVLNPLFEPLILRSIPAEGMIGPALRAMLHNTATPTVLRAGEKTNVIPSTAEAEVDCRMLPGQSVESLLAEVKPILGEEVEVEVFATTTPYESDYHTELYELFGQVLAKLDPGSTVVPFLLTGSSDGRYLAAKGVKVYGFSPMKQEPGLPILELAHGRNERISVENLLFGTRVLYEVVRRFCGEG
ncbi:MAG TPA: M20/M25/M40 family metallo-hydrolase [Chloroflexi bacterium]|nr:M20/M25/M40 family metallo-hydrolase [Chloroflexota bacterium]